MKKLHLILVFFLLSIEIVNAQSGDHLEPVGSIFGINYNYHSRVRQVLFEDMSDFQIMQFIIFPSFGSESILAIELDTVDLKNPKFTLVYHKCMKSVWYTWSRGENVEDIEVTKYRKEISGESVDLIRNLFNSALNQTKYKGSLGLDGVTYYFIAMTTAGKTWSPNEGTKMKKLVEIGYALIDLAKDDSEIAELDRELVYKIENLIKEFTTANSGS